MDEHRQGIRWMNIDKRMYNPLTRQAIRISVLVAVELLSGIRRVIQGGLMAHTLQELWQWKGH